MAHTPGPWAWKEPYEGAGYYYLENEQGQRIHSDGSAGNEYTPDLDVFGDDARLIAAAPDLLEACKQILFAYRSETTYRFGANLPDHMTTIAEAIAKAEGKPS